MSKGLIEVQKKDWLAINSKNIPIFAPWLKINLIHKNH
jgi:hypothetical protein